MYCVNCGAKLNAGDRFCENCGTPVWEEPATVDTEMGGGPAPEGTAEPVSGDVPEGTAPETEILEEAPLPVPGVVQEETSGPAEEAQERFSGPVSEEIPEENSAPVSEEAPGEAQDVVSEAASGTVPEAAGQTAGADGEKTAEEPASPEDATVPLTPPGGQEGRPDNIPNLEKKIMKNMEDELIFEMPEAVMGAERQQGHGSRPPRGNGAWQSAPGQGRPYPGGAGYGGQPMPGYGDPGHGGGEPPVYETYISGDGKKPPKKKKKKKALIITLVCVIVALLAALVIFLFIFMNPERRLRSYIQDRDWGRVEELYEDKFADSDRQDKADEILRQEVDDLCAEFENGTMDYPTVKRHLSAIADFWEDAYVQDAMDRMRTLYDSRSAFEEAEAAMAEERYEEAIGLYGQVAETDPNYQTAQEKLETARSQYRSQVLEDVDQYEKDEDFAGAAELLENALLVLPGDTQLEARRDEMKEAEEEYLLQTVLEQAESFAKAGNYFSAIDVIENALEEDPGNTELEAAYEDYCRQYEEDILAKAEAALGSSKNYDAALIVLDNAINTLDGDYPDIEQALREKREEYVQEQLAQSAQANEAAALAGVWQGSQVIGNGITMSAQDFLTYSGMSSERLYMEFHADGALYVDLLGQEANGTWQKDPAGSNAYILTIQGDGQQVTLEADGTMRMELGDVVLIFAKAPTA